jgi:hypothetical protein
VRVISGHSLNIARTKDDESAVLEVWVISGHSLNIAMVDKEQRMMSHQF